MATNWLQCSAAVERAKLNGWPAGSTVVWEDSTFSGASSVMVAHWCCVCALPWQPSNKARTVGSDFGAGSSEVNCKHRYWEPCYYLNIISWILSPIIMCEEPTLSKLLHLTDDALSNHTQAPVLPELQHHGLWWRRVMCKLVTAYLLGIEPSIRHDKNTTLQWPFENGDQIETFDISMATNDTCFTTTLQLQSLSLC